MANPQAEDILTRKSLVIFTEPHASIPPKNYEKEQKIPISRTAISNGTNDIAFPNKRLNQ